VKKIVILFVRFKWAFLIVVVFLFCYPVGYFVLDSSQLNDNNPFLSRVIGISSIAGLRGRKSNYIYGSAKSGFHQYLFGLRQELKNSKIIVQAITPGFVNTKMTKDIPLNKLSNSADQVAEAIITKTKGFEVYPNIFWWCMSKIIKYAPEFIISKL
jgi:short-subunit dehydrogenase